ncbi:hypothetical protein AMECASPLE_023264 [Ameca splendens]|uniref:Uncharacterized protein n=1 Tax=Ameca splendens TaxID=208324 RepID=A0ABV0ZNX1_9TELE
MVTGSLCWPDCVGVTAVENTDFFVCFLLDYFLTFHPSPLMFFSTQFAAVHPSASLMLMVLRDSCVNNSSLLLCCPVIVSLFQYHSCLSLLLATESCQTKLPLSLPH